MSRIGHKPRPRGGRAKRNYERSPPSNQSEAQFRLLVRGVIDYAIYMLDPEGVVSSWNLGAQRIKGYRPG